MSHMASRLERVINDGDLLETKRKEGRERQRGHKREGRRDIQRKRGERQNERRVVKDEERDRDRKKTAVQKERQIGRQ